MGGRRAVSSVHFFYGKRDQMPEPHAGCEQHSDQIQQYEMLQDAADDLLRRMLAAMRTLQGMEAFQMGGRRLSRK